MASTKTKSAGLKEDEYNRIVAAIKLKMEKGTDLVVSRNGKIEHIKPEDIKL
jgi:hypothetical protein